MKTCSLEEYKALHRPAIIAGMARRLGLVQRVPELMRKNGWPVQSKDLVSVLIAAVACKKIGAGATRFRRPEAAERLGGLWPAEDASATASAIVDSLELDRLLDPA